MTRREWLSLAIITGTALLPASCGGDEDEERSPQQEPSTGNANALEAAKEPRQFTLAYLEHPYAVNPPKPSILGRDVKSGWDSGSIPGAREGSTLQLVPMPHKTDERYQLLGLATAVEYLRATAAADSSVADVVWLPSLAQIMELMRTELLAPLERWLQSDNANPLDAFSEEARRLVRVRGRIRGLPLSITPGVLGHNASFFERANVTGPTPDWKWQDFIDAGKRLTLDANEDGDPEQYGFSLNWDFPDWEPLLLQEGGEIIDLDTGLISIEGPETERALTAWDELGRVHGMHPYGPEVTELDLRGFEDDTKPSAMRFSRFKKNPWSYRPDITPMPGGSNRATPLSLEEVIAVPAAGDVEGAYEALVPLAHWIGERRVLPAVTAGWQYLEQPDTDHFDLILPKPMQAAALEGLAHGKASYAASSPMIPYHLFHQVTLPLARGEVVIEQAIDQAANWLQSYLAE